MSPKYFEHGLEMDVPVSDNENSLSCHRILPLKVET